MKLLTFEDPKKWLEWKQSVIGGTDANSIMEASPFQSRVECWAKKMGLLRGSPPTPQMRRGLALEPRARKEYEKQTGLNMPPICAQRTDIDFIGVTLDGFDQKANRTLEIKCPGRLDHELAMRGEIPIKYKWQLVHICMVTGTPYCDYFSYSNNGNVIIPFKRDYALEEELIEAEIDWWQCVLTGTVPGSLGIYDKNQKMFFENREVFLGLKTKSKED